jgi:hypothetical protein
MDEGPITVGLLKVTTVDTAQGRCGKQQCAQSEWGHYDTDT